MARKRIERPNNERLVMAFENAGYDVMDDNFTKTVAAKMLRFSVGDVPLIEWSPCYNDRKELDGKLGSIGRSINKHLGYDDCTSISGDWVKRYCLFLDVSADFLFGLIDDPTHQHTDITAWTGLSTDTINQLHRVHSRKWQNTSDEYAEPHKAIDGINMIFSRKASDLLRDIYDYATTNVVLPDHVDLFDDDGSGHRISATGIYKQYLLHQITAQLDSMALKKPLQ